MNEKAFNLIDDVITINKRVITCFKPVIAVFLINLIEYSQRFDNNSWFCYPHNIQQKHIFLSLNQIGTSKKILKQMGVIAIERKPGIPSVEHYKINYETLYKLLYN